MSRKFKILSVGSIPPEWGGRSAGGVATYQETLFRALQCGDRGEIVAIIPTNARQDHPSSSLVKWPPDKADEQREFYLELAASCDVVLFNHIYHRWVRYHALGGMPRPSVGVIHSWHGITYAKELRLAQSHRERTEGALKVVDALVFPSRHALEEGKSLRFSWDCPTSVIPYPLRKEFMSPSMTIPYERKQVLFVGELSPRKRPLELLEAVALIPDLPITYIGDGTLAPQLERLAIDLGVAHRVCHLGMSPPSVIREELSRSAVMCLPSSSESFGLVYIEALACGTPVIGLKSVFEEIQSAMGVPCGIGIPNNDLQTLKNALETVITSRWDRDRLRSRAVEQFAPHRAADKLLTVVETACRSKGP